MRALIVFVVWAGVGLASAQQVQWKPGGGTLPIDRGSSLQLVFDNCQPESDPEPPEVDGLIMTQRGTSQQVNIVNFNIERTVVYDYQVRPTREGRIEIPAFKVRTDKGEIEVKAADFEARGEPRNVTLGQNPDNRNVTTGTSEEDLISMRLTIGDGELWEGEVAEAQYEIKGWQRVFSGVQSSPQWNPDHLVKDDWGSDIEEFSEQIGGRNYIGGRYRADVMAEEAGTFDIDPVQQVVAWRRTSGTGVATFDRLLGVSRPSEMQSNPLRLRVKALPENAPARFTGAVGAFTLNQEIVPAREVKVGEPVTWTIECHGRGNWPMGFKLPDRSFSSSFRVIQPKTKLDFEEGTQFQATMSEDMVLIPKEPGTFTLGSLEWSYFDPQAGEYKTVRTAPVTIQVVEADAPLALPAPSAPRGTDGGPPAAVEGSAGPAPVRPQLESAPRLPRDWIEYPLQAPLPWPVPGWLMTSAAPLPLLLLLWLWFSLRHAPRTDANRLRRQAGRDLGLLLAGGAGAVDGASLRRWRALTCQLWEVQPPVPRRADIELAVRTHRAGHDQAWGQLWEEAEAALYHPQSPLPGDWLDRARAEVSDARVPAPPWWHAFLPRNLFPLTAALVLLMALCPPAGAADDARADYQQGNYAGAEAHLRRQLGENPLDAGTRHNLGLTLLQQQRPQEALAWFLSAWLNDPAREDLAWNLEVAAHASGIDVERPASGGFAARLSPRQWQSLALGSFWTLLLGFLGLLIFVYRRRRHFTLLAAAVLLMGTGAVLSAASFLAWSHYGILAEASAVMVVQPTQVRSIPSDISEQILLEATPGLCGTVEKDFLGWRLVRFPSGQVGWLRNSTLVPLYRAEP